MSIVTETQQPITQQQELPEEPRSQRGTPTWEMARFYPHQGEWTEEQYLALDTNNLIEFDNGMLEFLPMPTDTHQRIAKFLLRLLDDFVESRLLGEVFMMGYPVRLPDGKSRQPDIVYVRSGRPTSKRYVAGADIVVEIVSELPEDRRRDLETKREDYAAAGIPEYWIVDPETQTISVLTLDGEAYKSHGELRPGETATSVLLDGFTIDVKACFDAAVVETGTTEDTE
ncbi:MAG: Uma2 family endonuclease [Planctomycetaceae bacterium]|nr:Uma2 family endonuclease [Planctomycetaceae bacterium]